MLLRVYFVHNMNNATGNHLRLKWMCKQWRINKNKPIQSDTNRIEFAENYKRLLILWRDDSKYLRVKKHWKWNYTNNQQTTTTTTTSWCSMIERHVLDRLIILRVHNPLVILSPFRTFTLFTRHHYRVHGAQPERYTLNCVRREYISHRLETIRPNEPNRLDRQQSLTAYLIRIHDTYDKRFLKLPIYVDFQ